MNFKNLIACFFLGCIATSCIQDEALSSEAAIDGCTGSEDVVAVEINADAKTVDVFVNKTTDCSKQSVKFTLPQGATIKPANDGAIRNFTSPQKYTVTSEDGKWSATYTVAFINSDIPTNYHFEDITLSDKKKFQIFYDFDKDNAKALRWSSGNKGFELTGVGQTPEDYPTAQDAKGKVGKCLKLVTRNTGSFGAKVGMPIAAGNMFIGTFDVNNAIANARKATLFGFPYYDTPVSMTGFYKFKSGETFTNEKGEMVSGKKDKCDIYAIFYETDNTVKMLNGDNSLTHENLISVARIENPKETDNWTEFNLPFEMKPGKSVDPEKLRNGKYNISIVFSSSIDGAYFNGAVGSTLYIDEVKLNYK